MPACDNVTITITNNDTPEEVEVFYAVLRQDTNGSAVCLGVNMTNTSIFNNDNATIIIQRFRMVSI